MFYLTQAGKIGERPIRAFLEAIMAGFRDRQRAPAFAVRGFNGEKATKLNNICSRYKLRRSHGRGFLVVYEVHQPIAIVDN